MYQTEGTQRSKTNPGYRKSPLKLWMRFIYASRTKPTRKDQQIYTLAAERRGYTVLINQYISTNMKSNRCTGTNCVGQIIVVWLKMLH